MKKAEDKHSKIASQSPERATALPPQSAEKTVAFFVLAKAVPAPNPYALTPDQTLASLKRAGVITKHGNLSKAFR